MKRRDFLHRSSLAAGLLMVPSIACTPAAALGEGPVAVSLDSIALVLSEGRHLVIDRATHELVLMVDGSVRWRAGGLGTGPGELNGPTAVSMGADALLYVVDRGNHRVQVFNLDGGHEGSVGADDGLLYPYGAAHGPDGRLYLTDSSNHRVQVYDRRGQAAQTLGAFSSDAETAGGLNFPLGIGVATNGEVHVVDRGHQRVQVFSPDGAVVRSYGEAEGLLSAARAIALDAHGNSYVGVPRSGQVVVFGPSGQLLSVMELGLDEAALPVEPRTLTLDAQGTLHVVPWRPMT